MILLTVSFLLGVLTTNAMPELQGMYLPAIISTLLLIITVKNSIKFLSYALVFTIGFSYAAIIANSRLDQRLDLYLQGKSLTVTGIIGTIPTKGNHTKSFNFATEQYGLLQLRWYGAPKILQVGDKWQFTVKLKRALRNANPGSFDIERWFLREAITATGYIDNKSRKYLINSNIWTRPIDRLRQYLQRKIITRLADHKLKGIILAVVIGEKSYIDNNIWQILQDTGIAHLVAISGLHVGLLATAGFLIFKWLWRCLPPRYLLLIPAVQLAAIGAVFFAISYAMLAGFSITTQRACIMVLAFMSSVFFRGTITPVTSYCVALIGVLLIDPLSVLSAGFWLSFAAVAVILYGSLGRLQLNRFHAFINMQWLIFVGLIPVSLAFFSKASLVAPIANIVAIPWVSFLVIPCSLLGAISFDFILDFAVKLLNIIWPLLDNLANIESLVWQQPVLSAAVLFCAVVGVLWVLAPKGIPARSLGLLCFLPLIFVKAPMIKHGTLEFTLLDVGQGLSAVIKTKNHLLIYDAGPFDGVVLPFLLAKGYKRLDKMIISHPDKDHIAGAFAIAQQFPKAKLQISNVQAWNLKSSACRAGQSWHWDGIDFLMLHPENINHKKTNEHSCVLKVSAGNKTILLTGDIGINSERQLIAKYGQELQADILLVPHHGSKTSSSLEFIRQVNPTYALIPVGYRNRYGHPKKAIVARYLANNIKLFNSVHSGAISFLLDPNTEIAAPKQYRLDTKKYWHFLPG